MNHFSSVFLISTLCVVALRAEPAISAPAPLGADSAQFCLDWESFAKDAASQFKPGFFSGKAKIPVFVEDSRYGRPLDRFWELFTPCLSAAVGAEVSLHSDPLLPGPDQLRRYLEAGAPGSIWRLGAPHLTAELTVERLPFRLGARIRVLDTKGRVTLQSRVVELSRWEKDPELAKTWFEFLRGVRTSAEAELHQSTVERLGTALAGKKVFLPGSSYAFKNEWFYAEAGQIAELKKTFARHFGFRLDGKTGDSILLLEGGHLRLSHGKQTVTVDSLVEATALLADTSWDREDVYHYPVHDRKTDSVIWTHGPYSGISDQLKNMGTLFREAIQNRLARAYADDSGKADFKALESIFIGGDRSILWGTVKDRNPGREKVEYHWTSAKDYLKTLRDKANRGVKFEPGFTLLRVYAESGERRRRFWGIVSQTWKSRDSTGKVRYEDDGFLFVSFDLGAGAEIKEFSIYNRLWFYNYLTDGTKKNRKGRNVKMCRFERIDRDITAALDSAAKTDVKFGILEAGKFVEKPSLRGIDGIDQVVTLQMKDDLVRALRNASSCQEEE